MFGNKVGHSSDFHFEKLVFEKLLVSNYSASFTKRPKLNLLTQPVFSTFCKGLKKKLVDRYLSGYSPDFLNYLTCNGITEILRARSFGPNPE